MIDRAVRRGIADIKRDPERSIRNLVELGEHFASGRFQKSFFQLTQNFFTSERSPYYTLIENTVNQVDSDALATMGINVGYMSWTYGARIIRRHEQESGYNIPWAIYIDYNFETDAAVDLSKIVAESALLGIYTFLVFVGEDTAEVQPILAAAQAYPDRAFLVYCDSDSHAAVLAESCATLKNMLLSLDCSAKDLSGNIQLLRAGKRLVSLHCHYDENNVEDILSGRLIENLLPLESALLFFIPQNNVSDSTRDKVWQYVVRCRLEQTYPIALLELYSDVNYADQVISVESCMAAIRADGTVFTPSGAAQTCNAKQDSLDSILRRTMPRVRYTEQ